MLQPIKKYSILLVLSLFTISCGKKEVFPLPESEYVILSYDKETMYSTFIDLEPTKLSQKELIIIEELFQEMLIEHNAGQARALVKHNKENPTNQWERTGFELETKGFKRQYLPVINKKGEKIVWVNFLCRHFDHPYWRNYRMKVMDGGNCYYNFKVNLTTKKVYDLHINGYA